MAKCIVNILAQVLFELITIYDRQISKFQNLNLPIIVKK